MIFKKSLKLLLNLTLESPPTQNFLPLFAFTHSFCVNLTGLDFLVLNVEDGNYRWSAEQKGVFDVYFKKYTK